MPGLEMVLAVGSLGLCALGIAAVAGLKGWNAWLDVRRLEIANMGADRPAPVAGGRIELADLRERVRKLEAIAAGIDD